ncbi:MAG TPA: antibiotic biosynthesis monooxygenase [Rhodanobacter sp.]|nr:antibiotic biosynthesis monooxygenase [Rhodanobacter sp.]
MFVAIYRWRLHPERERDFVANWQRITMQGLAGGSGGSSLFRNAQGVWVAIARWPSREARDHFFGKLDSSDADAEMSARARLAVIERLPDEELDSVLDCWAAFPDIIGPSKP